MSFVDDIVLIVVGIVLLYFAGPVGSAVRGEGGRLVGLLLKVLGVIFVVVGFILLLVDLLGLGFGVGGGR